MNNVLLELSATLSTGSTGSWRFGAGIFLVCLLSTWLGPTVALMTLLVGGSASRTINRLSAFLWALPLAVFPYCGLVRQKDRTRVLSLGTAWGLTTLQWGSVAMAFAALARGLPKTWQVVLASVTTILFVTGLALAVFWLLKLTVRIDAF